MVSKYLLPNWCKAAGWLILIPSFILGVLWLVGIRANITAPVFSFWSIEGDLTFFSILHKNIYNEIVALPLIMSLLMVSFAKEKQEDEYIQSIRLDSLIWAVYVNFLILLITVLFLFQGAFYNVMIFNMFTTLILFIIKFNIVLSANRKNIKEN